MSCHGGDHFDELDRMIVEDQLDWDAKRIQELESGLALLGCVTLNAPVNVREIAEPIAQRVVELLNEEALISPMLVDAAHAGRLLGITEDAFRTRLQRGQVPRGAIVRTGGRVQFRPERLVRDR